MNDEETKIEETQEETIPTSTPDKAEEYLNNWKRERADFLNYKKDESKRIEQFVKFANEDVILEMIDVMDTLELALDSFPGKKDDPKMKEWLNGLESIMKQSQEVFKKYGVEKIEVGNKFDPALQEAIETEPGGDKIVQVRSGYMMHDKVLRPARVKITK
jgi:molecular chaperone GrpE